MLALMLIAFGFAMRSRDLNSTTHGLTTERSGGKQSFDRTVQLISLDDMKMWEKIARAV